MRISFAVLSCLLLIANGPVAHAHASLSHANPSDGSALSTAPQEVTLTFTANGIEVSQGKGQVNGNVMGVSLKPLSAGIYKVNWRAVSTDTHKTEGSFTFSVDAH